MPFYLFSQHGENALTTFVRIFVLGLVDAIIGFGISSVDTTLTSRIYTTPEDMEQAGGGNIRRKLTHQRATWQRITRLPSSPRP